jgi:uncharacterized protein
MYQRHLQLSKTLNVMSCFLFGPRQTGKSTLIRQQYPSALHLDLLSSRLYQQLSAHPENLKNILRASKSDIVVIDEIQKLS